MGTITFFGFAALFIWTISCYITRPCVNSFITASLASLTVQWNCTVLYSENTAGGCCGRIAQPVWNTRPSSRMLHLLIQHIQQTAGVIIIVLLWLSCFWLWTIMHQKSLGTYARGTPCLIRSRIWGAHDKETVYDELKCERWHNTSSRYRGQT